MEEGRQVLYILADKECVCETLLPFKVGKFICGCTASRASVCGCAVVGISVIVRDVKFVRVLIEGRVT